MTTNTNTNTNTFNVMGQDWSKHTLSIDEGIEKITDEKRSRQDITCPLKHMRLGMNVDDQIVVEYIDGREFIPTEHALRQMATWMHVPHGFLKAYSNPVLKQNGQVKFKRDKQDTEILLTTFKNGIRDSRVDSEKQFRFRTYTDGTLRAMLSDRYAIIDNIWYLQSLRDSFKKVGCDEPRLMKWMGNADTIYGNMLLTDGLMTRDNSDYGGMISISNCEIGIRRLSLTPSIFRSLCTNGMIFGKENGTRYSRVHRGNVDLVELQGSLLKQLSLQIPTIQDGLTKLFNAQNMPFDSSAITSNLIAQIVLDNGLSTGINSQAVTIASEFATHEKTNANLFGLINAVTRAGQSYDNEDWVKMDEIGGKLAFMSNDQWTNLNNRAKAMDDKVRNKVFGIVAA